MEESGKQTRVRSGQRGKAVAFRLPREGWRDPRGREGARREPPRGVGSGLNAVRSPGAQGARTKMGARRDFQSCSWDVSENTSRAAERGAMRTPRRAAGLPRG